MQNDPDFEAKMAARRKRMEEGETGNAPGRNANTESPSEQSVNQSSSATPRRCKPRPSPAATINEKDLDESPVATTKKADVQVGDAGAEFDLQAGEGAKNGAIAATALEFDSECDSLVAALVLPAGVQLGKAQPDESARLTLSDRDAVAGARDDEAGDIGQLGHVKQAQMKIKTADRKNINAVKRRVKGGNPTEQDSLQENFRVTRKTGCADPEEDMTMTTPNPFALTGRQNSAPADLFESRKGRKKQVTKPAGEGRPKGTVKEEIKTIEARKSTGVENMASLVKNIEISHMCRNMVGCLALAAVIFIVTVVAWIWNRSNDDGSDLLARVCVASHSSEILSWAQMIYETEHNSTNAHSNTKIHKLTPVLDEETKPSDSDLAVLGEKTWFSWFQPRCDRVVVVVDGASLVEGRNPLHKYTDRTGTRKFLNHPNGVLAIVNTTCKTMIKGIDDGRTGRMEECSYSRRKTFEEFCREHSDADLLPKKVKDVPSATDLISNQNQFKLLFTDEQYESPNDDHSSKLLQTCNRPTHTACGSAAKDARIIPNAFPKFQFVLVGKEGAGKSTTAYWLAYHLKTPESVKNTFTSVNAGTSFTRSFQMVEMTSTTFVADTMGLPQFDKKYLCAIKRILAGSLVQDNGNTMEWSTDRTCKTSFYDLATNVAWYLMLCALFCCVLVCVYEKLSRRGQSTRFKICFLGICVILLVWVGCSRQGDNVNEVTCCESPNNQNRDLQAHAILFVIRYSDSSWESEIAAIKKLLRSMKEIARPGSDFDLDMTERMVFGITDAPRDEKRFKKLVKDLNLPSCDVFAINSNSDSEIFIPEGIYLHIMNRLQQKACMFFSNQIQTGIVRDNNLDVGVLGFLFAASLIFIFLWHRCNGQERTVDTQVWCVLNSFARPALSLCVQPVPLYFSPF